MRADILRDVQAYYGALKGCIDKIRNVLDEELAWESDPDISYQAYTDAHAEVDAARPTGVGYDDARTRYLEIAARRTEWLERRLTDIGFIAAEAAFEDMNEATSHLLYLRNYLSDENKKQLEEIASSIRKLPVVFGDDSLAVDSKDQDSSFRRKGRSGIEFLQLRLTFLSLLCDGIQKLQHSITSGGGIPPSETRDFPSIQAIARFARRNEKTIRNWRDDKKLNIVELSNGMYQVDLQQLEQVNEAPRPKAKKK